MSTVPRPRRQRVIDYPAQRALIAVASIPWERPCPDCGAPARRPCYAGCLRFAEDPGE